MEDERENIVWPFVVSPSVAELSRNIDDYPCGIILPIDKPYRWTSADVIRKLKYAAIRHFGRKNLKIGHAGTLDPLATGILIVCIGRATKLAQTLMDHDKEYVAELAFGATTPSYDLEKEIDRFFPYGHITEALVREKLAEFVGEQEQVAPLFSAKSIDGVRAYEHARRLYKQQGNIGEVETALIKTARINISEVELLGFCPATPPFAAPRETPSAALLAAPSANRTALPTAPFPASEVLASADPTSASGASSRIHVATSPTLQLPHATIRLACSKGTYVRAFARDLGEALASGAHLTALRRTASGPFRTTPFSTAPSASSSPASSIHAAIPLSIAPSASTASVAISLDAVLALLV